MRMQDSSSLGSLSSRFLELIEDAEDGILDLRRAAEYLQVPKRRVYDVTNVLEGVDLLEKTSKNTVRWKREETDCKERMFEKEDIQTNLETELRQLEETNEALEAEIENVLANTQKLIENEKTRELLYLTPRDVKEIASLDLRKVFAFETPLDASLHRSSCPTNTPRQFCTKFFADSPTSKIRFHDVGASLISKSMESDEGSKENQRKE